jgi:hypothetical protein
MTSWREIAGTSDQLLLIRVSKALYHLFKWNPCHIVDLTHLGSE